MSLADVEARLRAEQQQIDDLERQIKGLVSGAVDMAAEECHRFADAVAAAKQFVEDIEAPAA